jgi:Tfp pilus assembly protein PilF
MSIRTRVWPVAAVLALVTLGGGCAKPDPLEQADRDRKARAHYAVAMEHLREGRVALSIRELQAAEEITPQDPWVQLALGEAYRVRGKDQLAEQHLKRAIALRTGFQPALLNLSALYIQLERYEEAVEISDGLLADATFPVPWKALTNRGYAQMKMGRGVEARKSLLMALDYHADYWPAILDIAILDAEEGKSLDSLRGLERVLELDPGSMPVAEAHYRIALIYISLGNRDRAVHHLEIAAQSNGGEWGKRSEDYLQRLR